MLQQLCGAAAAGVQLHFCVPTDALALMPLLREALKRCARARGVGRVLEEVVSAARRVHRQQDNGTVHDRFAALFLEGIASRVGKTRTDTVGNMTVGNDDMPAVDANDDGVTVGNNDTPAVDANEDGVTVGNDDTTAPPASSVNSKIALSSGVGGVGGRDNRTQTDARFGHAKRAGPDDNAAGDAKRVKRE